tara:strand:- start:392 stop:997 length:606 start_codon:yes stop_codon:yes gene_type:complete
MRNLLTYLFLIINFTFYYPCSALSKVVGDKIILGSVISLTGNNALKGIEIQKDFNSTIDNINKMGGVKVGKKNYSFQIIYYDDESNPVRANQITKRLVLQEGVQFVLGPYSLELTEAIIEVTEKNQVLLIEINNTYPTPIPKDYKYAFSMQGAKNPINGLSAPLLIYKDAIERANSLDISKIRDALSVVIQIRNYLADIVS